MRLTKTVGQYLLGNGALAEIDKLLSEKVASPQDRVVYLIDHYFKDGALAARLPVSTALMVQPFAIVPGSWWPPNSWRIADRMRSAKVWSRRERKRV